MKFRGFPEFAKNFEDFAKWKIPDVELLESGTRRRTYGIPNEHSRAGTLLKIIS